MGRPLVVTVINLQSPPCIRHGRACSHGFDRYAHSEGVRLGTAESSRSTGRRHQVRIAGTEKRSKRADGS